MKTEPKLSNTGCALIYVLDKGVTIQNNLENLLK